jgi:hypothetical protein
MAATRRVATKWVVRVVIAPPRVVDKPASSLFLAPDLFGRNADPIGERETLYAAAADAHPSRAPNPPVNPHFRNS